MLKRLPWLMVWFRLTMGFVLLADARDGHTGWPFVVGLMAALLSDIFDGILGRRTGTVTVALRRADSWVDATLFVLVAIGAWLAHQEVLVAHQPLLVTMLVLFVLSQIPSFLRFGKAAAFHAYSAKAMGLAFIPAGILLFGLGQGGWPLDLAMLVAIISHIDRALIALILPAWQTDIVWFGEALRIRREALR